ncbi:hypothetical protein OS493_005242 [Desmophyllum pertusum]|uniref:SCP domain-containing protein n=1 Tax=Desmophyllum pertusum TaxID=174260 RepID=A0A9W9Z7L5_9CNID|nr:hypothetical protein OS493_005242 [Desmophyllum pertusum]
MFTEHGGMKMCQVTDRIAVIFLVFCASRVGGANGFKVTGGNVQFSADQKSLTIQLQLDGTTTGTPVTSGGTPTGGTPTSQGGGGGGGSVQPNIGEFTQNQRDGLKAHNDFRRTHGAPLMTLDKTMCKQAAAYAAKIAQSGIMKHSQKNKRSEQGENLSMGCSTNAGQTVKETVTNW